jgi:hypothetical protein
MTPSVACLEFGVATYAPVCCRDIFPPPSHKTTANILITVDPEVCFVATIVACLHSRATVLQSVRYTTDRRLHLYKM